MIKQKWFDKVCIAGMVLAVILTVLFANGEQLGLKKSSSVPGYVNRLFDDSKVHTINLQVEDWDAFLENARNEEYVPCTVTVDGEEFERVGLRAKGNNSQRLTHEYGLSRYSLKLEFDQYLDGGSYYGLDKFSLDASFQDNSYMKNYMTYEMMDFMGVPSPLCSYVWVTVNGEAWGLFLAVEEPEEAFAKRVFGKNFGQLYKPDYRSLNDENLDIGLVYTDDNPENYDNIFSRAKFDISDADKQRVIEAIKILSTGENLEQAIDVDEVLRYFAVQVFVMNWDSYIGRTGHNYFLYEEDGILSILPWDYNLAYGTYALGMTNPIKDPGVLINYPINTPADGDVMKNRPLYHNLMKNNEYFTKYYGYMNMLVSEYFESGQFETTLWKTEKMIAPYVEKDPTAFCSYEDHMKAVEMLQLVCELRAESVKAQLAGEIPATIKGQNEYPELKVDVSGVNLRDLGDFDDLKNQMEFIR